MRAATSSGVPASQVSWMDGGEVVGLSGEVGGKGGVGSLAGWSEVDDLAEAVTEGGEVGGR